MISVMSSVTLKVKRKSAGTCAASPARYASDGRFPQALLRPLQASGIAQGQPKIVEHDGVVRVAAQEQLQQLDAFGLLALLKLLDNRGHRVWPLAVRIPGNRNGLVIHTDCGVAAKTFELSSKELVHRFTMRRGADLPGGCG